MKRRILVVSGVLAVAIVAVLMLASAAHAQAPAAPAKPEAPKAEPAKPAADANVVKVKFDTSKGVFVVEVHKDWAPKGADRFLELVKIGYFNGDRFFRVVPGFVVQWGIAGDPKLSNEWMHKNIADDPVKESNKAGTITFAAASMPNTRSTQVFINFKDNTSLDRMGFAPFGKVIQGMDVVNSFNAKYNEQPTGKQGEIAAGGNEYLDKAFPGLDYIKTATIEP